MKATLFGDEIPTKYYEILEQCPVMPHDENAVLLAFSGGNDSRTLAHVVKPWFANSSYNLELAAIETGLSMGGWKESVIEFAEWVGLPVSFWEGEGTEYYKKYVEEYGFPGNAAHGQIQTRLKGRAYRKMYYDRRSKSGDTVWVLSGLRKHESRKRKLLKSPYSNREGLQFINPLFYWKNEEVVDYMIENDIPLSPFKQGDCKCGATTPNADIEWADIKKRAPALHAFLCSLQNPMPWEWGKFDKSAHAVRKQVEAGQIYLADGLTIEHYPTCINCWRDDAANDERLMTEWG